MPRSDDCRPRLFFIRSFVEQHLGDNNKTRENDLGIPEAEVPLVSDSSHALGTLSKKVNPGFGAGRRNDHFANGARHLRDKLALLRFPIRDDRHPYHCGEHRVRRISRLASVLARDDYMPHQFSFRGDRLAFSTGIAALGGIASILVLAFQGNVDSSIHLYAIGVLLAFSMSNSGMVIHWLKIKSANWKTSILINGAGAILSIITLIIVTITKFALGAWIVIVLIPIIVSVFLYNHHHYSRVKQQLQIIEGQEFPTRIEQLVVVPIDDLNYASLRAIAFARTISRDAVILHIGTNEERAQQIKSKIQKYAPDMKLVIVDSPWRAFVRPLLAYVDAVHSQYPSAFVTIVLPEFITARWWDGFLHNRSAARLREAFVRHPNVAVVLIPYLLEN